MNISNKINKILHYFQRGDKTAKIAKERLQIIIAHERNANNKPKYLTLLQKDLLEVIAKYVEIEKKDVKFEVQSQDSCSILEVNVTLPHQT